MGALDGRKRNDRAGVRKGGNPLIGLCILSAETESMSPKGVLAKSAAVRASVGRPASSQSPLTSVSALGAKTTAAPLLLLSHPKPLTLGFGRGLEPADAGLRFGGG